MRKPTAALVLSALLSLGADAPKEDAVKEDLKKLQGKWDIVRVESDGAAWDEKEVKDREMGVVVKDATISFRLDREGMKFTLDPTQKPKSMDIASGGDGEKASLAIYELDGDTLKICVVYSNNSKKPTPRPTEFKTQAKDKYTLFVCKRAKG